MNNCQRFEKFVDKQDCWTWTGARRGNYGSFRYNGKMETAHRIAHILYNGEIPAGLIVRHKCRNRLCVHPDHLEVGTLKENQLDRFRDNTMTTKLNVEQVLAIRASDIDHKTLAAEYEVSEKTIRDIRARKTWTQI